MHSSILQTLSNLRRQIQHLLLLHARRPRLNRHAQPIHRLRQILQPVRPQGFQPLALQLRVHRLLEMLHHYIYELRFLEVLRIVRRVLPAPSQLLSRLQRPVRPVFQRSAFHGVVDAAHGQDDVLHFEVSAGFQGVES